MMAETHYSTMFGISAVAAALTINLSPVAGAQSTADTPGIAQTAGVAPFDLKPIIDATDNLYGRPDRPRWQPEMSNRCGPSASASAGHGLELLEHCRPTPFVSRNWQVEEIEQVR